MKKTVLLALSLMIAAGALADDSTKAKFLKGLGVGKTSVSKVIEVLGPPDAVLLLKTDTHESAKEFREYAPAGDTTERDLYWYNPGCQPVVVSVRSDGKVSGVNATYYVGGCSEGFDQYLNLPAKYACSNKDRAPHCK